MAFTMHSHSGEFCSHATDTLEKVVQRAIALGFRTMGLTEHMPRAHVEDLYPEEIGDDPEAALASLRPRYDAYLREAVRLRDAYADRITLLVGFEAEWIRGPDDDGVRVQELAAHPAIDYFIGSVHHVGRYGTPIDYDKAMYATAIEVSEKAASERKPKTAEDAQLVGERRMFADYYDQQFEMLQTLQPRVVGHFDLVRLFSTSSSSSSSDNSSFTETDNDPVWSRILRNLRFIAAYGGWLECNTAALRKGLSEPYPARPIAQAWLRLGGRFTLSDDSHGVAHVATNYRRGLAYLSSLGVTEVWTFSRGSPPLDASGITSGSNRDGPRLVETSVSLEAVSASLNLPVSTEEAAIKASKT